MFLKKIMLYGKTYPLSIYLLSMLCIFLFVYDNYYFNITKTKYTFFVFSTVIATLCYIICKGRRWLIYKKWNLQLSIVDKCFMIWIVIQVVSVVCSSYFKEAIDGSLGRNTGLIFSLLCVSAYWIVSRSKIYLKHICMLYLTSCSLLHILAILNFYSIDLLGFYTKLSDYQSSFFISTTGNINFYASIICLSLPISCYLYIKYEHRYWILLFANSLGFFGLICGNSDSGYLGIGLMFLILLYFSSKTMDNFKRCIQLLILFFTCGKVLSICSMLFPVESRLYYTLSSFVTESMISTTVWLLLIGIYFIMVYYEKKIIPYMYYIRVGIIILYLLLLCMIIFLFIYLSFFNKNIQIGYLSTYFRWNDNWGTGRAKAWKALWESYQHFSYIKKLFGFGPDTTRVIMLINYAEDAYLIQFDNAHNEYLQYLMTTGIIGLVSYLSIFICIFYQKFKYKNKLTIIVNGLILTVGIYLFQACVNINQPISTPLLFICLGLIENEIRGVQYE